MFCQKFLKILIKGGEYKVTRKIIALTLFILLALGAAYHCFAVNTKLINITATVPSLAGGITADISKIDAHGTCDPGDDTWTIDQTTMAFGNLVWDTVNDIFQGGVYFAVDVGVLDNSGNPWTITHTRTNFQRDAGNNLNGNVNVSFMKQTTTNPAGTLLQKVSYGNSNNVAYNKAQLSGGWLRIYYGFGTGDTRVGCTDASGVTPVTLDKPTGDYSGQVTLTLTGV